MEFSQYFDKDSRCKICAGTFELRQRIIPFPRFIVEWEAGWNPERLVLEDETPIFVHEDCLVGARKH